MKSRKRKLDPFASRLLIDPDEFFEMSFAVACEPVSTTRRTVRPPNLRGKVVSFIKDKDGTHALMRQKIERAAQAAAGGRTVTGAIAVEITFLFSTSESAPAAPSPARRDLSTAAPRSRSPASTPQPGAVASARSRASTPGFAGLPSPHTGKPDLDNLEKAVLDAITRSKLWKDDKQVSHKNTMKRYVSDRPSGIAVYITRDSVELPQPASTTDAAPSAAPR